MKSQEFCYWLQGFFELAKPVELNAMQTDLIQRHLNMVFFHEIDPSYPAAQQKPLQDLHDGVDTTTRVVNEPPYKHNAHSFGSDQLFLKC